MYRAASPYRAPSPYRAASPYHGQQQPLYGHGQQQQQQQPSVYGPPVQQAGYGHGQVQPPSSPYGHPGASPYQSSMALQNLPGNETIPAPGSITYTTTTTPDGRITYHPFKAVSASYKTPNGIVSGIQWVPAEATHVFPAGAQPASEEFTQSWQRGTLSTGDPRQTKDWQKTEEKRRRREEKESAKLLREKRREEEELRYAREADHGARERRKSFNAGAPGSIGFPSSPYGQPTGYPGEGVGGGVYGATAGYAGSGPYSRERKMSTGHGLADQFSGLDIEPGTRQRKYSQHESAAERARKLSGNFGGTGTPYQTAGSAGSGYAPATGPYGGGGTQRAYSTGGYPGGASPNIRPADLAYPSSTTPSYGYGTALEAARSRATTPIPGVHSMGGASPRVPDMQSFPGEQQQLAAPEGFSRPLSAAHTYPPFEPIKIQNMDSFLDHIPRMPAVLTPHDVYIEDWSRFVQDLSLAWAGRLPVPAMNSGHKPKRSTLSGDLIELWNSSFFLPRGVEAILYKGRERRTGNLTGTVDLPLSLYDDDDESDDSSTTDSEEDSDAGAEKYETTGPGYGLYGGRPELAEAKRRRRDAQMERRRKRKEKKIRRKAKARAKAYSLVFITVSPGGGGGGMMMGGGSPMPGSMPMPSVQGMGMVGSMHGGHAGSGIGMPGGIGGIGGGY